MNITTWAEKEIELACRYEIEGEYGRACYESALKIYKSLCEERYGLFSIYKIKHILNRLIDRRPLTPIEDTDDVWISSYIRNDRIRTYQCTRMGSLFKDVYPDGTVKYIDNHSNYCVNINDSNYTWYDDFVNDIIQSMFPVTMPYMPGEPIKVYCEEFLTDKKNGDRDTLGVLYAVRPDGPSVEINRYFKEEGRGFIEIDKTEYEERRKRKL